MHVVCAHCGLGSAPPLAVAPGAAVPRHESVVCQHCLERAWPACQPLSRTPAEALAGDACATCYERLSGRYTARPWTGTGLVRRCRECARLADDGRAEAAGH
jgi:hypothetical protein